MNTLTQSVIDFIYKPEEYTDSAGRIMALLSLFIGTVLLFTYLIYQWEALIPIGILFTLFCLVINSLILIILLLKIAFKLFEKHSILQHVKTLFTMLINIPVSIFYILLVYEDLF